MGVGSLVAPLVVPKLLKPFTPGRGRYGKALVAGALGAVAATTVADRRDQADRGRRRPTRHGPNGAARRRWRGGCRRWEEWWPW